jgi:hypothetical protein
LVLSAAATDRGDRTKPTVETTTTSSHPILLEPPKNCDEANSRTASGASPPQDLGIDTLLTSANGGEGE